MQFIRDARRLLSASLALILVQASVGGASAKAPDPARRVPPAPAWSVTLPGQPPCARERMLIRIRSEALQGAAGDYIALADCPELTSFALGRPLQGTHALYATGLDETAKQFGLDRDLVIELLPGTDLLAEREAWAARPEVEWAELDWMVATAATPNDTYFGQQWALRNTGQAPPSGTVDCDIDADQAWDVFTGSAAVKIAIVDTGVDLDHPDLMAKIVAGYDFVNGDASANDDNGHGTACASLAAAISNNGVGVTGVDWQARIMPIKVLDAQGYGTMSNVASGINWARQNGAGVISMSLGAVSGSSALEAAVNAAHSAGVVVVAAAGNDNMSAVSYPARYANCLAVGALSPCNQRKTPGSCDGEYWWGSNYGANLDVMAPGVLLRSAWVNGYISNMNGTSGATPHVAGVAALLKGRYSAATAQQICDIITSTADNLGAAGWDAETGWGRVNAYAAILAQPSMGRTLTYYATHCSRTGTDWNNINGALGAPGGNDNQNQNAFAYNDVMASSDRIFADQFGSFQLLPGEHVVGVYVNASARYDMNTSNNRLRMVLRYLNNAGQSTETTRDTAVWSQNAADDNFRWRMQGNGWDITGLRSSWSAADINALDVGARRLSNTDPVLPSRCRITAFRIVVVTSTSQGRTPPGTDEDSGLGAALATGERSSAAAAPEIVLSAYPNPFNPKTTIAYELAQTGEVAVMVFDLLGRQVRVLERGEQAAGRHEVGFDASGLASGIYFVTVRAGGASQALRISLVK